MSKKIEKKQKVCPKCGGKGIPTGKTWPLTSPMALMGGNIPIMGTFECQECGKKFKKKVMDISIGEEEEEN